MRYRSRTQHQQEFRPVVAVLANSILPLWYLDMAHKSKRPSFELSVLNVELELDKAYEKCKKLAKGPYKYVVWILDVEPLLMVEENKGNGRTQVVEILQGIMKELYSVPIVKLVINNPSYEVWIQLHFERITEEMETTGEDVLERLKTFIPSYAREASFYYADDNLFAKTQGMLSEAKIRARALTTPDFPELKYACTMMPVVMSLFENSMI